MAVVEFRDSNGTCGIASVSYTDCNYRRNHSRSCLFDRVSSTGHARRTSGRKIHLPGIENQGSTRNFPVNGPELGSCDFPYRCSKCLWLDHHLRADPAIDRQLVNRDDIRPLGFHAHSHRDVDWGWHDHRWHRGNDNCRANTVADCFEQFWH